MTGPSPLHRHLIVICGLPGTGKTTLAMQLAERLNALHLNTDKVRIDLGLSGHYTPEDKSFVYATLWEKAAQAIRQDLTVILDGTFALESYRARIRQLAAEGGYPIRWIVLTAKAPTIRQRVQSPRLWSEADYRVYLSVKKEWEPLEDPHLVISTDRQDPAETLTAIVTWLHSRTYAP